MATLHSRRTTGCQTSRTPPVAPLRTLTGRRSWNTSCPVAGRIVVGTKRHDRGKRRQRGCARPLRRSARRADSAVALVIGKVQFEGFLALLHGLASRLTGVLIGQ